ncbi:DUF927 domain-containing protein [Desulfolutivibrio sp.]|uniref:DUF927 domain-containing protein n=1 Tax=Desulfolutivibrio sp. TaxID=2773296 RepID=UPI002F961D50
MSNPAIEFRAVLEAAGLIPVEIIGDGAIHRCGVAGKEKGKDGAYLLHLDNPPSGWWRNYRTGQEGTWTARNDQPVTPEERRRLQARIESDKAKRVQDATRKHAQAGQKAKQLLAGCALATKDHPYLSRKGVTFVEGIKLARDGRLVLPVYDATGDVMSVQFIANDGLKRFLTGGRTKGGYFPIEGSEGPLYIAEGFATAASIHAATASTVFVAFNAGNLEAVAAMARAKHPQREIVLCVDDDREQKDNPGLTKGVKAAQQIRGLVAFPTFADRRSGNDFNDLALAEGLDVVRVQLAKARAPDSTSPASVLPHGFEERKGGIFFLAENKDGDITPEWVCSSLRVLALTRDADNQEWGRLLEVVDPDGAAHKWALPMSMLSGNGETYRAHLLSLGLRLVPGGKGNNRLHMLLSLARPELRARCASRIGWFGARFVLPEGAIGEDQGEEIILQGVSGDNPFRVSGSIDDWRREIGAYCVGNSRLILSVSLALAAPLLFLTNSESGGFHLVAGSSLGKTTALAVAGSVCGGGGLNGYIRQWRVTSNGLEAVAAAHCDTLLCLDELSQVAAREAGEAAYMLANGTGKARANRKGEGRKPAAWRILFLSTGEISLADKVREDANGRVAAGQTVRVVDIPADASAGFGLFETLHGFPDGGSFSRHLKEASQRFYGAPLRAFLEHVAAHLDTVPGAILAFMRNFSERHCPHGVDGQVRRVLWRFAMTAAAGELGASIGVLPWPKGEAENAALVCFQAWLMERGGLGALETQTAISQVRAFIETHGASRFQDLHGEDGQRIVNRAGFRQTVDGRLRYCFFSEAFKREVCAGLSVATVCKALLERGLLVSESTRHTLTVRTPEGRMKCYVVTSAVMSGDGGDSEDIPEDAKHSLSPSTTLREGTAGTDPRERAARPRCPQLQNEPRGQRNTHDFAPVPTVPIVPAKNGDSKMTSFMAENG